ncbi:MAG TPA: BlaI/MecI/CopY family transcriptional regulator [Terriglobales bacterium]|nr:BlaI/MecI/CopY family transcriptional regulator [Terriglobales bacterium]
MRIPGYSKLELRILEVLWERGQSAIREIQESLPRPRPAYTTVQTMVYRLEKKRALRRVRKIGNAHIFAAAVSRNAAHRGLLDHVLALFGGRIQPLMAHWAESGQVSEGDIQAAEKLLRDMARKRKPNK